MKISMILTSLIVAMSLTGCDYAGNPEKKASDTMDSSSGAMDKTEDMKDPAPDAAQPAPPPE